MARKVTKKPKKANPAEMAIKGPVYRYIGKKGKVLRRKGNG